VKQPFDVETEQCLLAAAMLDASARRGLVGTIDPRDFQGPRHRAIFAAIQRCEREGLEPDANNVSVHAEGEDYGGLEYLKDVASRGVPSDVQHLLGRLKRAAAKSRAAALMADLDEALRDPSREYSEAVAAVKKMQAVLVEGMGGAGASDVERRWEEAFDGRCEGRSPFVSTGYGPLDQVLVEGLAKRRMTIVAGRPRAGKSIFVVDMVRRLLEGEVKPRILVLPLESGPERWLDMLVASSTEVPMDSFVKRPHELDLARRERIRRTVRKAAGTDDRLEVMDNPFLQLSEKDEWTNKQALNRLEEIVAVGGYDVIFVDRWQRMLTDLRPQMIAAALVRMQAVLQRYEAHGVFVHQLGRQVEKTRSKKPSLVDLKDSGAYEEVADVVLTIHRDRMYSGFVPDDRVEVTVAKQKLGEDLVTMIAEFRPAVCRLVDEKILEDEEVF
jgi:replicative DNA helicase